MKILFVVILLFLAACSESYPISGFSNLEFGMSKTKVIETCKLPPILDNKHFKNIECDFIDDDGTKYILHTNFDTEDKLNSINLELIYGDENTINNTINYIHNNSLKQNSLTTPLTTIYSNNKIHKYEVFDNQIILLTTYYNHIAILYMYYCTPNECQNIINNLSR